MSKLFSVFLRVLRVSVFFSKIIPKKAKNHQIFTAQKFEKRHFVIPKGHFVTPKGGFVMVAPENGKCCFIFEVLFTNEPLNFIAMKKKSFIGLLFLMISMSIFAQQTTIEKAWESFKTNKITESRKFFIETTQENPANAEAYLMLSILATIDRTPDEALSYFIKFTEVTTEDINPYLRALWYTESVANGIKTKIDAKRVDFLKKLLESGKLNPTTRAYALETLGDHYKLSNELEKSNEYFNKIESVISWQIAGEFDNVSGSGFDKLHDPIVFAQPYSVFTNKYQAPVKWFEMKEAYTGRWLDLTHHFLTDNSVIFAQTFCYTEQQQDVVIRIGTSGSLKTWVNDKLLFTEADERNNGTDTYAFTARLNKGYNRILLQIGSSEIDRSNFLVRITDLTGNSLGNLAYSASYQNYNEDKSDFLAEIIPPFTETYFIGKIENEPENLLYYLLLSSAYMANDKCYFAQKTIQKVHELAPDCSYVLLQLIYIYLRDDNRTDLSIALERLKDIDPESPLALRLFYNEAIEKKDYDEAKKILSLLEKSFGRDAYVLTQSIIIAAEEDRSENLGFLVDEAYSKYPENDYFVYFKYLLEKERTQNTVKSASILKKFFKQNYSYELNLEYTKSFFETEQIAKGFDDLLQIVEFEPSAAGYYNLIGQVYFKARLYNKAISYYEKCLELAPYVGSTYKYLAKCYFEMNDTKNAIACYREALKYDPNDYESREDLRKLEGKNPVFSNFETPDLYKIYKDSQADANYPGENSIILLQETQQVVYAEGGNQEKSFLLVKVLNAEGIDKWKEYEISYGSNQVLEIEKAEVLKKNGSKVKAETNYGHIVFPSLEEGDAISLIFKLDTYKSGKFIKHFNNISYFSYSIPAKTIKYSLLISPNIQFRHLITNADLKAEVTKKGDFELYKWENHDIPSVKHEEFMPAFVDVGAVLHISTIPDWNFLAGWYNDVTNFQLQSDFILQEKMKELFDGKENLTQMEKAKTIYDFVTTDIRYSSVPFLQSGTIPQKASKVISTRMGDCKDVSTLFVAMCREAGIPANLVLINSRTNGKNETLLPAFNFNHSIAKVNIDDKDYFVELTSDLLSFGSIWSGTEKSVALLIDENRGVEDSIFCLNPATKVGNSVNRNIFVDFEADKMIVKCESKKTGRIAANMRYYYKGINKTEQEKILLTSVSKDFSNAELLNLIFDETLENSTDEIVYHFEYQVNNIFTKISTLEIFRIPFADNLTPDDANFGNTRKHYLEFWKTGNAQDVAEQISIKIPEGKQLAEMPENIDYQNKIARYQLTFKVENNVLIADRKLTFTGDEVSSEDYPEFKEFFNKIIAADAKQIAFQ